MRTGTISAAGAIHSPSHTTSITRCFVLRSLLFTWNPSGFLFPVSHQHQLKFSRVQMPFLPSFIMLSFITKAKMIPALDFHKQGGRRGGTWGWCTTASSHDTVSLAHLIHTQKPVLRMKSLSKDLGDPPPALHTASQVSLKNHFLVLQSLFSSVASSWCFHCIEENTT